MAEQAVQRIVPNIYSDDMEASALFYTQFLGLEMVMDMGWIVTFASASNASAQISVLLNDKDRRADNSAVFLSVEVKDVEAMYEKAQQMKYEIIYLLREEEWGVKRFFVKDPNGAVLNILQHSIH